MWFALGLSVDAGSAEAVFVKQAIPAGIAGMIRTTRNQTVDNKSPLLEKMVPGCAVITAGFVKCL